jgi:hypothetical protein
MTQDLSITTFRYVPPDLRPVVGEEAAERYLDALNRDLLDRLQRGGEAFVSNAVVGGRYVLRACIVNFHTARTDVEAVVEIVARTGRTVDAALRRDGDGKPALAPDATSERKGRLQSSASPATPSGLHRRPPRWPPRMMPRPSSWA